MLKILKGFWERCCNIFPKLIMDEKKRGVYFLSNDRLLEQAIAFLNSYRMYNPELPICLIPFDSDIVKLKKLQSEYNFSIFLEEKILAWCDDISFKLRGKIQGKMRKLACWQGEFEEFIYIDLDTVVLDNFDFAFKLLANYDFISAVSDTPNLFDVVWEESARTAGILNERQLSYAMHTGFFLSRRDVFTKDYVEKKIQELLDFTPHMKHGYVDQPIFNYLIVTSGKKYTSLGFLARQNNPSLEIKTFGYAEHKGKVVGGKFYSQKDPNHDIFMMHWCSYIKPTEKEKNFISFLKKICLVRKNYEPVVRIFGMPYRKLWKYYRYLRKLSNKET